MAREISFLPSPESCFVERKPVLADEARPRLRGNADGRQFAAFVLEPAFRKERQEPLTDLEPRRPPGPERVEHGVKPIIGFLGDGLDAEIIDGLANCLEPCLCDFDDSPGRHRRRDAGTGQALFELFADHGFRFHHFDGLDQRRVRIAEDHNVAARLFGLGRLADFRRIEFDGLASRLAAGPYHFDTTGKQLDCLRREHDPCAFYGLFKFPLEHAVAHVRGQIFGDRV